MYNFENYFYLKSPIFSFISISDTLLLFYVFFNICNFIIFIIFILLSIAFFTVFERKLMAAFQKRKGPNIHGFWGFLQAFADGLKLLLKEDFVPSNSNVLIFRISPIFTFFLSLAAWAIIPFFLDTNFSTPPIGILYIFALSSLSVYGIILSGWASNSKYAFLGSLRSAAQMISYEVSIGFILIGIIYSSGSLDLRKIIYDQSSCWYLFKLFPLFLLFFISTIAETNRAPFDLPEAEAELVSGYNVEYGGISFALFFLAEYGSIILMSALTTILFLGGWNFFFTNIIFVILFFVVKIQIILILFVWIRVAFPRYRYDQLMALGWKVFLPLSMAFIIFISILNIICDIQAPFYTSIYCDLELAKVSPNEDPVILGGTALDKRLVKGFYGEEGRHIFLFKVNYLIYTCEYNKIFSYILYPIYFKSDLDLNKYVYPTMCCIKYINY